MLKTMKSALRQNDSGVLPRWPHLPAHAILGLILFTSLLSWGLGYSSCNWALLTFGVWGAYGLLFLFSSKIPQPFVRDLSQSVITISIIMSLYFLLGHLGFAVIPWDGDRLVAGIDRLLGGGLPPVVMISNRLSPWFIESCAFAYALFIPYLYLSIFLCLLGRSDEERPMFVAALTITYAVSFAGYLLLPAHGPLVYNKADFSGPLQGGYFLDLVVNADLRTGGRTAPSRPCTWVLPGSSAFSICAAGSCAACSMCRWCWPSAWRSWCCASTISPIFLSVF